MAIRGRDNRVTRSEQVAAAVNFFDLLAAVEFLDELLQQAAAIVLGAQLFRDFAHAHRFARTGEHAQHILLVDFRGLLHAEPFYPAAALQGGD